MQPSSRSGAHFLGPGQTRKPTTSAAPATTTSSELARRRSTLLHFFAPLNLRWREKVALARCYCDCSRSPGAPAQPRPRQTGSKWAIWLIVLSSFLLSFTYPLFFSVLRRCFSATTSSLVKDRNKNCNLPNISAKEVANIRLKSHY